MIKIIEKEPYYDNSIFTGQCWLYPTYMLKDGMEYFMFNRREPDDKWKLSENEGRKKQLIDNDGIYFTFYSFYADPFDMLKEIAERRHTFTCTDIDEIVHLVSTGEFVDFHGNREEVSAAFFYRIYDQHIAEQIRSIVEHIMKKEFNLAMHKILKG